MNRDRLQVLGKLLRYGVALALSAHVGAQTRIHVAYTLVRDSTFGRGVEVFEDTLKQLTGGRFVVEHMPSQTDELEILNKVKAGTQDMGMTSTGAVGNFAPEVKVLDLPFLFTGYAHARTVLDGPVGEQLLATLNKGGLQGLAWSENGFRHITNNRRPIVYPADLAGLQLRTMQNSVHMEAFRSLKVTPVPMAFGKVVAALKAGELDGQENPLPVILSGKMYEAQKYLSLTQHFYSAALFTISPKLWNSLSEADKKAFKDAAHAGAKAQRQRVNLDEIAALSKLAEAGMTINSYVNSNAFRVALRPLYANLLPGVDKSLVEKIQNSY